MMAGTFKMYITTMAPWHGPPARQLSPSLIFTNPST